ncbi:MAG TPA: PAS domain S-box protein [Symbiobacteriaceae bacterium]|jgi:diguanylate cyclase (GGDEF)-like protein/PAS domain S-box-containing protein
MSLYIPLESLTETTSQIVLIISPEGQILMANTVAATAYGYSMEELRSMSYYGLCVEDEVLVANQLDNAFYGGAVFEAVHRRRDGSSFLVEVSAGPVQMDGRPAVLCHFSDITLQRRSQSMQLLLREFDQRVLRGDPLATVLKNLCDGLSSAFGYPLVWIGAKEPDGAVAVLAWSGSPDLLRQEAGLRWDESPEGFGPAGIAIRSGRSHLTDVYLALPLMTSNGTLGALSIRAKGVHSFHPGIVSLLTDFVDQVAISILSARRQEQVKLQTAALESAANAVMITDRAGLIRWVNPAFVTLTGYTAAEAVGRTPQILTSGAHEPAFWAEMWTTVLGGQPWHGEIQNRHKDGAIRIHEVTITPVRAPDGAIASLVGIMQDATERRRLEDQLRHMAMHDPVTELPNRRLMQVNLERMVHKAKRGFAAGILRIHVDGLHQITGRLDLDPGAQIVAQLIVVLQQCVRPYDLLARLGDHHFVALLEDADPAEAMVVAERMRLMIASEPFTADGQPYCMTVSIGVAPVDGNLPPEAALLPAETALQAARQAGGDCCVLAS